MLLQILFTCSKRKGVNECNEAVQPTVVYEKLILIRKAKSFQFPIPQKNDVMVCGKICVSSLLLLKAAKVLVEP